MLHKRSNTKKKKEEKERKENTANMASGDAKGHRMMLKLRTLDRRSFEIEAFGGDTVADFISRIEDTLGTDNLYKVIYFGKILEETRSLSEYNIDPTKCLVLIITKTNQNRDKPSPKSPIEEASISAVKFVKQVDVPENTPEIPIPDTKEIPEIPEKIIDECTYDFEEEDVIEDDFEQFVTEREFTIALDVIMTTNYLKGDANGEILKEDEVNDVINKYSFDEMPETILKTFIINRLDQIYKAALNRSQLDAFLNDIEDIYSQKRNQRDRRTLTFENELEEEVEETVETDFERMVRQIEEMGFQREKIVIALGASFNNPDQAVEYLMTEIPAFVLPPEENPLAFLRHNDEFKNVRQLVKGKPELLPTLLLSFGGKNPQILDLINRNKIKFLTMINEPEGCKGLEDDSGFGVDPTNVDVNDGEAIGRLKELGFPEEQVLEAYFASSKNENMAVDILLSHNRSRS